MEWVIYFVKCLSLFLGFLGFFSLFSYLIVMKIAWDDPNYKRRKTDMEKFGLSKNKDFKDIFFGFGVEYLGSVWKQLFYLVFITLGLMLILKPFVLLGEKPSLFHSVIIFVFTTLFLLNFVLFFLTKHKLRKFNWKHSD